jgi:membrane protein
MSEDNLSIIAAGVGFFLLLGVVPSLAAAVSIYGLVADPSEINRHFESVSSFLPPDAAGLLKEQLTRISAGTGVAGLGAALSILLALWTGSKGMTALMDALNIAYDERETRGTVKLTALAIGLTLFLIVVGLLAIGLVVAVPAILKMVGIERSTELLVSVLRWPLLIVIALLSLAVVYRYAPNRDKPRWRWISWGAVAATALWLAGSGLFSYYVSHFGNYNKTYGSLGAVVILLLWFFLSAYAVLLGAELNSEMEHQTRKDTTTGPPEPMGQRNAYVADTLGDAQH